MAMQTAMPGHLGRGPVELPDELRYVARQPILNFHGRVHGYELLFRNGAEAAFRGDGDLATRTMLDNAVIFGLETLTVGLPAFINCTEEALKANLVQVLPAGMAVLEILETVEPRPEIVRACRKLKAAGYRIALDDFVWEPHFKPFVDIADYIKVDFSLSNVEERRQLFHRLQDVPVAFIAEKVETEEQFEEARSEGFAFVQGYYFCRPVLMGNPKVPANRLSQIEILRLLRDESPDLRELTRLVKRDASLTYRLLRLVNSPLAAVRQEVTSIRATLIAVGEEMFRRIATLAITSELNAGRPAEILRMAFVRGRFCEVAASLYGMDSTEQYLLGILSLLPAMLRIPMNHLTPSLPLRNEIRQALEGLPVPEGCLLDWIIQHEQGDWPACDRLAATHQLTSGDLVRCYTEAVAWAETAVRFA